ncbi:MAG: hypothetical protein MZV70_53535 [Desulfobacterales bacterium]|nr:hypothetical protein [Desulfobacterales bacterium]
MDIVKGSAEDSEAAQASSAPGRAREGHSPSGTKALDQFTINLTAQAPRRARSTRSWAATSRSAR